MITLGLLFPWMTRKFILWEMTFPEVILYYTIGINKHLDLNGLGRGKRPIEEKMEQDIEITEDMDAETVYNIYHNRQFDINTWPKEIQDTYNA
jgi:hypothetical protein